MAPKKGPSPKVRYLKSSWPSSLRSLLVKWLFAALPIKFASLQDIAEALEIEKKCLYLMSRETATELANLKVGYAETLLQAEIELWETRLLVCRRKKAVTSVS